MTATDYRPQGFRDITPYLSVPDAEAEIRFLEQAFSAEVLSCHREEDGRVAHSVLRIGDCHIEVGQSTEKWGPRTAGLHFYVPDTDAVYSRALEAGGVELYPPEDMPYGERSAGVKDPGGNSWWLATWKGVE